MVPNSCGNSGHGLPWVGTHLKGAAGQGQQVGTYVQRGQWRLDVLKEKRGAGNPQWLSWDLLFEGFSNLRETAVVVELFGSKDGKMPSEDITK